MPDQKITSAKADTPEKRSVDNILLKKFLYHRHLIVIFIFIAFFLIFGLIWVVKILNSEQVYFYSKEEKPRQFEETTYLYETRVKEKTDSGPEFKQSANGKISVLNSKYNDSTYDDFYYLYLEAETDGDLFHADLLISGSVVNKFTVGVNNKYKTVKTVSNSFVGLVTRSYKKFFFLIDDLKFGENNFEIALYPDDQRKNQLDKVNISITRNETGDSVVSLNGSLIPVKPDDLFRRNNIDFEKDKIWDYLFYLNKDFFTDFDNNYFSGNKPNLADIKIDKVGQIEIEGTYLDLYKLYFSRISEYMYLTQNVNGFYFYEYDNKLYYITNSLMDIFDNYISPVYLNYFKSSPYILPDSILDVGFIPIDLNNKLVADETPYDDKPFYCNFTTAPEPVSTFESYKVYKSYAVEDVYGICKHFVLIPAYFKDDVYVRDEGTYKYIDTKYNKLDVALDDGKELDDYYYPYWHWCGGSRGYRILDSKDVSYLESVGKTSTGENVYIFSQDMPYPDDGHLHPAGEKDNSDITVWEGNWDEFLLNQKNDYPIIVIQNVFGDWVVYFNARYMFFPGC
ncbi:hypothetical protein LDC_1791 [sediment metagenome]|uniref:Uncharacterized protein n=1 Tax=sediment metagenome TaxID=749907 RepID=D9PJS8_9ZZZZ